MRSTTPQNSFAVVGFDSAWTDAKAAPGAICAITFDAAGVPSFREPELVSFAQALVFVDQVRRDVSACLVALDQPTVVPNQTGSRPVDKVAASVISFVGGGVQPANRGKVGMFDDAAPVWAFKRRLGATEAPEACRTAQSGLFLIEVFPALALAGLHRAFSERLGAPKYNPANRKKFNITHWRAVTKVVAELSSTLGVRQLTDWAVELGSIEAPRKADQDRLDAAICVLVGLVWRTCSRDASALIGDLETGYMVTPVSEATRARLGDAAASRGVHLE